MGRGQLDDYKQDGLIIVKILVGTVWDLSKQNLVWVGGLEDVVGGMVAFSGAAALVVVITCKK